MAKSVSALVFDCADAARAAKFWAGVLGLEVDPGGDEKFSAIGFADMAAHSMHYLFQRVPERKIAKNRVHPDLLVTELESEVSRAVELGATRLGEFEEDGYRWVTLTDPEGNEFDIVQAI